MLQKKILIIDDSVTMRKLLRMVIESDPHFIVVGEAVDPYDARDQIKLLRPDILTLDIEMPRMDGLSFLKNLMRLNPMPVLVVSTIAYERSEVALQALSLGAIDYVTKPSAHHRIELADYKREVLEKLLMVAEANLHAISPMQVSQTTKESVPSTFSQTGLNRIIAIGASTGGTEAIRTVLEQLPEVSPPIVITQHIHPSFCDAFVNRLNKLCALTVAMAEEGDVLKQGHAYMAPGGCHLEVSSRAGQYVIHLGDGPAYHFHKPSVDVMFDSLLACDPHEVVAVILTGMGSDGAEAMKKLHDKGARTIAQSQKTCVIWGMPRRAVELGGVDSVVDLGDVAGTIVALANKTTG